MNEPFSMTGDKLDYLVKTHQIGSSCRYFKDYILDVANARGHLADAEVAVLKELEEALKNTSEVFDIF